MPPQWPSYYYQYQHPVPNSKSDVPQFLHLVPARSRISHKTGGSFLEAPDESQYFVTISPLPSSHLCPRRFAPPPSLSFPLRPCPFGECKSRA